MRLQTNRRIAKKLWRSLERVVDVESKSMTGLSIHKARLIMTRNAAVAASANGLREIIASEIGLSMAMSNQDSARGR
ncbi:MAG TPA: hypothetical protein PKA27_17120 [Fimbriimonadaceae bacterium]|nr:hypothetical protein [Fimbriimonadaceae bacterium]